MHEKRDEQGGNPEPRKIDEFEHLSFRTNKIEILIEVEIEAEKTNGKGQPSFNMKRRTL